MKRVVFGTLLAGVVVGVSACKPPESPQTAPAAGPQERMPAATASATGSSVPTAIAADEPKGVLAAYLKAMRETDLKGTLAVIQIPEESREFIEGTLEGEYARVRAQQVVDAAFPDTPSAHKKWISEIDDQLKELPESQTAITNNVASVVTKKVVFHLVRVKDVWKIDYLKTEGADPAAASMDLIHEEPKLYDEMLADLKAGRFKSRAEFENEENRRRQTIGR